MAKKIHTATEPATAPVSGRTRRRRNGLVRSVRSPVITLIMFLLMGTREEYPYHGRRIRVQFLFPRPGYPRGVPLPWTTYPRPMASPVHGRGTPRGYPGRG